MSIDDRIAYVYKLVEKSTGKWYVGSRTKKGCTPNDGYMGSSKIVTPLIAENPNNWEKIIIATGNSIDMLQLETAILTEQDAKNDPLSYNQHNGDGHFSRAGRKLSNETKTKISNSNKGVSRKKSVADEAKRIDSIRRALKGKPQSAEQIAKRSAAMSGKVQSEEHKKKRAEALRAFNQRKKLINNTSEFIDNDKPS